MQDGRHDRWRCWRCKRGEVRGIKKTWEIQHSVWQISRGCSLRFSSPASRELEPLFAGNGSLQANVAIARHGAASDNHCRKMALSWRYPLTPANDTKRPAPLPSTTNSVSPTSPTPSLPSTQSTYLASCRSRLAPAASHRRARRAHNIALDTLPIALLMMRHGRT